MNCIENWSYINAKKKMEVLIDVENPVWKVSKIEKLCYNLPRSEEVEYSNAIVHAFQKFKAPFSGKIVHIFPEQSAVI